MDEKKVSSGQKRPRVTLAESLTVATLADQGLSKAKIAKLLDRDPHTIAKVVAEVKGTMIERAQGYADLHWEGTQVAAASGNTHPAQWALERLGVVEDPKVKALEAQAAGPRFSVQIGIGLPGMVGLATVVEKPQSDAAPSLAGVATTQAPDAIDADIVDPSDPDSQLA